MERINSSTRLIGLLGKPISHTFSPLKHNYCFKKLGLNYLYLPHEINREDLKNSVEAMKTLGYAGFNVTFPYKIDIMEFLDKINENATIIGSVNCVRIEDGKLEGFNTDGIAYVRSLKALFGDGINGMNFLLLGCGGAGRAIAVALAQNGVRRMILNDIREDMAADLKLTLGKVIDLNNNVNVVPSNEVRGVLKKADIIINATSLGMHPYVGVSPIQVSDIPRSAIISDITYNPPKTQLLLDAEKLGCVCLNGLDMAVYEGLESSKTWTGVEPEISDMREILNYQVKRLLEGDEHSK